MARLPSDGQTFNSELLHAVLKFLRHKGLADEFHGQFQKNPQFACDDSCQHERTPGQVLLNT